MPALERAAIEIADLLRATLVLLGIALLVGCGSSGNGPAAASVPPVIAAKADVIITFDGAQHACVVALYSEPQGSTIPCSELVAFLRDQLRLPSGSIYDTRTGAKVDDSEVRKTMAGLEDAGYRFIGGH
ncbi:MAG TPA: hypothetical protein VHW71_09965 [Steroidobacteraceae bacterium]|jgi:hypothetical protein|nr:hypothetical protein [Steroidobacteraceae bacterium]